MQTTDNPVALLEDTYKRAVDVGQFTTCMGAKISLVRDMAPMLPDNFGHALTTAVLGSVTPDGRFKLDLRALHADPLYRLDVWQRLVDGRLP